MLTQVNKLECSNYLSCSINNHTIHQLQKNRLSHSAQSKWTCSIFLDRKHLEITKSNNTTYYLQSGLHAEFYSDAQLGSNAQPVSNVEPGSDALTSLDLPLKLHVVIYSFVAYQRWTIVSARYTLQPMH